MCGILGIVAEPGEQVAVSDRQLVAMRDAMRARGPDGAGLLRRRNVALAHRRLAIRDPAHGAQPWLSEDGQTALVYNGELYNDGPLRDELTRLGHRFRSRCDTEVVLEAYRQWGADCVRRFRGMFALGIYDFREDRLLLARDRFGIKPLFLARTARGLMFASSIPALLRYPGLAGRPHLAAVSHYLTTFRLTLGRQTLYAGIEQLLPGEMLLWHAGRASIRRYWEYPAGEDDTLTYDDAVEQLAGSLRDAVAVRLASDVPVGMFLSGGVDSSTIARLVRDVSPQPLRGECGGGDCGEAVADGPPSDFHHAACCAAHAGLEYGEVRLGPADFFDAWQELLDRYETPLSTPSDVVLYRLAARMKQSVGVALGGEGADELLCGYAVQHWSGRDFDASRQLEAGRYSPGGQRERQLRECLRQQYGRETFASEVDHYFALNSLIPAAAKPALLQPWAWRRAECDQQMWSEYAALYDRLGDAETARKHMLVLHRVNLEALLARLDSATMLASLEARVPFTDHLLVEQMLQVPHRHKIDVTESARTTGLTSAFLEAGGHLRSKRILRTLAGRLLPPELAERKKASFPTPVQRWLAAEWSDWARQRLKASPFAAELFQARALAELTADVPAAGMWLWPLLNVALWGDRQFAGLAPARATA